MAESAGSQDIDDEGQVVGGCGERHLHFHLIQASEGEAAAVPLPLQRTERVFHYRLASPHHQRVGVHPIGDLVERIFVEVAWYPAPFYDGALRLEAAADIGLTFVQVQAILGILGSFRHRRPGWTLEVVTIRLVMEQRAITLAVRSAVIFLQSIAIVLPPYGDCER